MAGGRARLEQAAPETPPRALWERHREEVQDWTERARAVGARRRRPFFTAYWRRQSALDGVPA
jgi:hypothetical protein